jgi:hypothetical protein
VGEWIYSKVATLRADAPAPTPAEVAAGAAKVAAAAQAHAAVAAQAQAKHAATKTVGVRWCRFEKVAFHSRM